MARDLNNKVIVITGASSGIGAATAIACAKTGMHVVLSGRRREALDRVVDKVRACGREALAVVADVAEPGASDELLDAAARRFGAFDVVFANAGYGLYMPMHEMTEEALRRIFEVNFFAACDLVCKAANRLIVTRRPGHLLMCSSVLARFTLRDYGAYCATKAAQHHVCRAMRLDLKHHGIDVSSVHPVGTRTGFHERASEIGRELGGPQRDEGFAWLRQKPETVARAVVRCLRRPKAEVWTSWPARAACAAVALFPGLMDVLGSRGQSPNEP